MTVVKKNRSKVLSALKKGLIISIIALVMVELLLRLFGYGAYDPVREKPLEIHGKKSIISDPDLGYRNAEGTFTFKFSSGRKFTTKHDASGARNPNFMIDPEVSFYGCSFTYGYGVNDSETYPYFVGEISGKKVRNAGCNGYGLIQAYLKMREDFENGIVPKVTVISYASFQDERTQCTPSWQQELFTNGLLGIDKNIRIPYVSEVNKTFTVNYLRPERQYSKLSEYSAILYRLEKLLLKRNDVSKGQDIAVHVLHEFRKKCDDYKSRLIVVGLVNDSKTKAVLKKVKDLGIEVCQFNVDITKSKYNLMPDDGHPSPEAYKLYAEQLLRQLDD